MDTEILNADIANFKGGELPSTGGTGTTMFYVMVGVTVLTACAVFVVRRIEEKSGIRKKYKLNKKISHRQAKSSV